MKLVVLAKKRKTSVSPLTELIELEPMDVAESIAGRLQGKIGGIYGPLPLDGDEVWCLIADAILRWTERLESKDVVRLRAVNHGVLMAYGSGLLLNKPSVPMHVRNLCTAVTPEFQFSAEVQLISKAAEHKIPKSQLSFSLEVLLGQAARPCG